MTVVIKTRTGNIFGTNRKFPHEIIKEKFFIEETERTVGFINGLGEKVTIPFENIDMIVEKPEKNQK